jgi:NAD(P)-dependent dehydrogenase (short-subunit alcohol dehydrogenase family)
MLLKGKVALVSGAGPGLGRAICLRLASEGAKVVVGDINEAAMSGTVDAVVAAGGEAVGQPTDITDPEQCEALVAMGAARFGGLDLLVNDAYHGGDYQRFEDADLENWKLTAEVNLWGTLAMTKAALPLLKTAHEGRIVNICTHGVDLIQPTFGAYTGSKAAIAHLTKILAAELGTYGIRVNAVFPGPIWGANLQGYLDQQASARGVEPQVAYDEFSALNVLNSRNSPEDIAGAVTFFCSDMARAVTGQALYVNSGETFH